MKHLSRKIVPLLGLAMLLTGCGETSSVTPTSSATSTESTPTESSSTTSGTSTSSTAATSSTATSSTTTVSSVDETSSVEEESSVAVKTITKIEVTTAPTKTSYFVGETFDATGMVVTATYDDESSETITDYTIDKTEALTTEDTTITITYQNLTATVTITVRGYDLVVDTADTYRLEAENLDKRDVVGDGVDMNEKNGFSSNGISIGHVVSGYFEAYMDLKSAFSLKVNGAFSKYEAMTLSNFVEVFMDGEALTYTDITLGRATDGSNDWFNWKTAEFDCGSLTAGKHVFKVNFKIGCNMDYLDFVFAA